MELRCNLIVERWGKLWTDTGWVLVGFLVAATLLVLGAKALADLNSAYEPRSVLAAGVWGLAAALRRSI